MLTLRFQPAGEADIAVADLSIYGPFLWSGLSASYPFFTFTFIINRFSPYEWFNPNFCVMQPEELETQWNLNNSVWHTVGALMQQGTDFCPVSLSGRCQTIQSSICSGSWWGSSTSSP